MLRARKWQRRRSAFNHDWLKNRYLPNLRRWLRCLDGEIEAPDFEARFESSVLPEWEAKRGAIEALLGACEDALSPRQAFAEPPLEQSNPELKTWLGDLLHALWIKRTELPSALEAARNAVALTDEAYAQIRSASDGNGRERYGSFWEAGHRLAKAIERLPSRAGIA